MKKKYMMILLLLAVGGSYWWWNRVGTDKKQIQYVTATARKGSITTSVSGSGNVIVDQSANIDPTISGTVTSLAVNVGDKVKKGQLLFNIDNNDLSVSVAKSASSLAQAQSSVESAKANKKQASADYSNAKKSGSGKSSADKAALKQKKEASEASLYSSQQSLVSAQADLANQRLNAAKRNVTSPIDGTVNAVNIKNGDDLSKLSSGSSRTVPIIIGDLGTMKAQVQINEVDIANVKIGQKAMMTFSAVDGLNVSGKVEKMDSIGTLSSGVVSYNVTIAFDTLDQRIKPEMSVSASIITDVKQDVLAIPNSAIKSDNNGSYVEILTNGSSVPEQKAVTTGASNNTDTEITGGINIGDKVITQTIDPNATTSATSRSGGIGLPGLGGGGNRGGGGNVRINAH